MRLFIAIQLSDGIRDSLSAVQTHLRDYGVTVPDVSMQVSGVLLMRSDRTKSGMVYTEVE